VRAINIRSDAIETVGWKFPHYTATEAAADRALHLLALPAATVAVGWLCLAAIPTADARQTIACVIYGCGLIGMLTASAAYNLSHPSRRKELLRRVDHAMIFVMIAGTYTPFAVSVFREIDGPLLCLLIWSLAATGVAATLAFPRRFERLLLMLYLIMGWMVLGMGRSFLAHLSTPVLLLLLAGGAAYTVGAFLHSRGRFPFQNIVWHALVVFGASLHWLAIARTLTAPT
jgi:hemolysin III